MPYPAKPLAVRLAARTVVDPETGCHNWTGCLWTDGYGMIGADGGKKNLRTHRAAYELAKGPIPPGLVIDHLCRNIRCCNPEHLEAVTSRENSLRGNTLVAFSAARTHCKNGHELSPENTYRRPSGGVRCRACVRIAALAAYHRKNRSRGFRKTEYRGMDGHE